MVPVGLLALAPALLAGCYFPVGLEDCHPLQHVPNRVRRVHAQPVCHQGNTDHPEALDEPAVPDFL
eukprot:6967538-Prymnesium_polylepis.1